MLLLLSPAAIIDRITHNMADDGGKTIASGSQATEQSDLKEKIKSLVQTKSTSSRKKWDPPWGTCAKRVVDFFESAWFETVMIVLLIVDVGCVSIEVLVETEQMMFTDHARGETIEHALHWTSVAILLFFMVEILSMTPPAAPTCKTAGVCWTWWW